MLFNGNNGYANAPQYYFVWNIMFFIIEMTIKVSYFLVAKKRLSHLFLV